MIDRKHLKSLISDTEKELENKGKADVSRIIKEHDLAHTFSEELLIKKMSAQVDTAIHAYGILLTLQKVLEDDEEIISLSLGAGNTGKSFDVVTTHRIAEFKFAIWSEKNNTLRQNSIVKDFIGLAEKECGECKKRYIYCVDAKKVEDFLETSNRSLESVFSRNSKNKKYEKYLDSFGTVKTVKDLYKHFKGKVEFISLEDYLDFSVLYEST